MASRVWHGPKALEKHLVSIGSLKYDPANARLHDERNIETLRQSFQEYGQVKLLVAWNKMVMAGNGCLKVCKLLKWTHVAIVDVSAWFKTKDKATAFALMDNKSGELAEWDYEQAQKLFKKLPDHYLKATGFSDFELEPLMRGEAPKPDGDGPQPNMVSIRVTEDQAAIIQEAVAALRGSEDDDKISPGRALELICADYMAGVAVG